LAVDENINRYQQQQRLFRMLFLNGGISDKVSYSKNSSELNGHSTVQTPQNSIDMQS
jgi:hypothetical protein